MAINPYGCVQLEDFGAPRVIYGKAREVISGGALVFTSGASATAVVSSGADSFVATDITVATGASGTYFTGVALQTTASGGIVPIALQGLFILDARGTVVAGQRCAAAGDNSVAAPSDGNGLDHAGKVITDAGSAGFCIVYIN